MTVYNYVQVVNDNLLCCICRMPFVEPLTTRSCSHTFCRECISTALHLSQHCPIDRSPLTLDDLSPADPLLRNLVDELQVECSMRTAGCPFTGQRQLLNSHLKEDCQFVSVTCLDGLCDCTVPRKIAKHADHTIREEDQEAGSATENNKVIECGGCHFKLSEVDTSAHEESCPDIIVKCEQETNGCEWNGPRRELVGHLQICSYHAIKGFFAIHDRKTIALAEENAILRHKVSVMDGIISSLRREIITVKAALGPWYRSDRYTPSSNLARSTDPVNNARPSSGSGIPSSSSHNLVFTDSPGVQAQATTSSSSLAHSADLASYFPEPEPDDWLPADYRTSGYETRTQPSEQHPSAYSLHPPSHQSAHLPPINRTPVTHAPYPHTQPSAYTPASPPQSPVAPLDISTSLEGSLLGLRESIVSLSGALDSLSRRQDVALTAESMRTAEEIRSLRAIIHGLRMQVHSIIMDRNAQVTGHTADESMLPWLHDPHEGSTMPWMRVPFTPRYPLASMSSTPGSAPKL